ncbi:DNA primase [Staphylococcus canis]|uniref:DNA primase n=1 Tax=Staphylococcus canis TaxID=2724942 RepID=A0ABS0TAH2_9STAP|nr:DNA primase [Staphylococcus canis]MBI5975672.1 DNA primase [Staphylococcus canis]
MKISQEVINEVKSKTDILDVVGEYVKLEKRGRNFIGLCPFHDEKTPSFTVSEDKQICHCFGCKKGGNVFQFIQEIENVSFVDAVKKLGERVNITIETDEQSFDRHIATDDLNMIQMHESLVEYYHYMLKKTVEGEDALNYLYERGFTDQMINDRKIGYAPNSSHFATDFIEKKGYDMHLGYEAGILSRSEKDFNYYDRFRNRIIFPLSNAQGRIVGFSGRTYINEEPKYLNSPETPIFQKRKLLYNLNTARKSIRQQDEVILLEGFMDVIKVSHAGIQNVVASMGTSLSDTHITFLQKMCSNITLIFDGDYAGMEATLNVGQSLLKYQFDVFVVQMPTKMDPDEYIEKYGAEQFKTFINREKKSFVTYKLGIHKQDIQNNDLEFEKNYKAFLSDASLIKSTIIKRKVIQDASEVFKVSADSLNMEVDRISPKPNNYNQYVVQPRSPINISNRYEKAECALLKHFMNDKDIFYNYHQDIHSTDFTNSNFKSIFNILWDFYSEHETFVVSEFMSYIDRDELKEILLFIVDYPLNTEPFEHEINDYINIITENRYTDSIDMLHHKLNEATRNGDLESQKHYLEMIVNKKREKIKRQD